MEYWIGGGLGRTPSLQYPSTPLLQSLRPKPIANFFSQPPPHPPFQLEPDAQKPVARKPRDGCRRGDPLMIELEVGFEFPYLQRLTEFSFEDRLDADGIARLDEHRDGLDW